MNLIITALLFNFIICCWPKTNIIQGIYIGNLTNLIFHSKSLIVSKYEIILTFRYSRVTEIHSKSLCQ